MIERKQYRGCLRAGWKPEEFMEAVNKAASAAQAAVEEGKLLNASIYRYKDMGFLYY